MRVNGGLQLYFVLIMKSHLQSYPSPLQINSFWNLGFLLGITIILQIITGIFLGLLQRIEPTLCELIMECESTVGPRLINRFFKTISLILQLFLFFLLEVNLSSQNMTFPLQSIYYEGFKMLRLSRSLN